MPSPPRAAVRTVAAVVLIALVAAGCYSFAEPSLHPGDSRDVMAALARHGVHVSEVLSGGSACDDPGLIANALQLVAMGPDDPTPREVFIYAFRVRSWDESAAAVDACQEEYAQRLGTGAHVRRVDVPTYRAFGADWSDGLAEAIAAAFEEASTQGG